MGYCFNWLIFGFDSNTKLGPDRTAAVVAIINTDWLVDLNVDRWIVKSS